MHPERWDISPEDYQLTEQLKQARVRKLLDDPELTTSRWECIIEGIWQRMQSSKEDVRSSLFWKGVGAEFLGTGLVVLIGCGAWVSDGQLSVVPVSLAFGIAVCVIMWTIGHLSGGHINPAVSFAMVVSRRVSLARGGLYATAQCLGAITGAAVLYGLTPATIRGSLGATTLHQDITAAQSFTIEALLAFVWVLILFATSDANRQDISRGAPLATGLTVALCHLYAVSVDQSFTSLNVCQFVLYAVHL
jgi:aquaporin-4